jgi:hypothetical protein
MKRVLSAIVIIAIVSSALAFAPANKGGIYCASLISGMGCTVITGKTEMNNGNPIFGIYYKDNAFINTTCPAPNSNCTSITVLFNEQ